MDSNQSSASTSLESLSGWQRPDVVVHLAAHAKVHELRLILNAALANMVMTHNVLENCRRAEVPIVFSNSREVYGDIERHCTRKRTQTSRPAKVRIRRARSRAKRSSILRALLGSDRSSFAG